MPRLRNAEQALTLLADVSRQSYVCRSCRSKAIRQFHSSRAVLADRPFYQRMRETLFGKKEEKEAEQRREGQAQKQVQVAARQYDEDKGLEKRRDFKRRSYEVAAVVDPTVQKEYVQSTTWDGLERIGSEEWVRAKEDKGDKYNGFMLQKRPTLSDEHWLRLLHHVTVEVIALQKAGRDLNQIFHPRGDKARSWHGTKYSSIIPDAGDGTTALGYGKAQNPTHGKGKEEDRILQAIPTTAPDEPQSISRLLRREVRKTTTSAPLLQYGEDTTSWLSAELKDPNVKFVISKRLTQLTGTRLPDPLISSATTLRDLFDAVKTKEKPAKVAQSPKVKEMRLEAPNVTVRGRRTTPIDKEKMVGRWKIIEDELRARGLPVTGSRLQGAKVRVDA